MKRYTESVAGCCEVSLLVLRETETAKPMCDSPEKAADYWNAHIRPQLSNPDVENVFVLLINSRKQVKGHIQVTMGTLDTCLVHPREVFRPAIVASAAAIVLMHNHPSGCSTPSEGDIRVTRELVNGSKILKIDILDHVIMGDQTADNRGWSSLRELGYFF